MIFTVMLKTKAKTGRIGPLWGLMTKLSSLLRWLCALALRHRARRGNLT